MKTFFRTMANRYPHVAVHLLTTNYTNDFVAESVKLSKKDIPGASAPGTTIEEDKATPFLSPRDLLESTTANIRAVLVVGNTPDRPLRKVIAGDDFDKEFTEAGWNPRIEYPIYILEAVDSNTQEVSYNVRY